MAALRDDEVAGAYAQLDRQQFGGQCLRVGRAGRYGIAFLRENEVARLTPNVIADKAVIGTGAKGG